MKDTLGAQTSMDTTLTIHKLFEEQVKSSPHTIAAIHNEQTINYKELNERANRLAHYLRSLGIKPEEPIGICLERSIDVLITIIAILKAGGTYTPLDPLQPENRLLYILNDNNNPLLITKTDLKTKFLQYSGPLLFLDQEKEQIDGQSAHNLTNDVSQHHLAYTIYTSGSTGQPKGVLIEHAGVVNYCKWFAEYSACQAEHRIDFSSNYIFDMAVTTSIVPLMLGLTVVICNNLIKQDVQQYLHFLVQNNINIIKMTPSYFKVLLQELKNHPIALPDLTTIILGGENLLTSDCTAWLKLYPEHILFNEYGPTEATVAVSQYQISSAHLSSLGPNVPIGKTGPQMYCYVLDENHTLLLDGEIGELYIGGINLARGYLNQPEVTEKKFIKNNFIVNSESTRLYKTGDLCRRLEDGNLEYLGRIDNQLKIRGFRMEPGEIERSLSTHPAIKDVVVLARKDDHDEKLVAYYILQEDHKAPNIHELQHHLEAYLPEYMIPSAFVRINTFPLTANGKLDRQALPVPRFRTNQHYLAPSTPMEIELVNIWSEELGIQLVGIEDNFFELGGHSLSAARIISKIHHSLNKVITVPEFYKARTIKHLSVLISQAQNNDEKPVIAPQSTSDERAFLPLSDFQFLLWLANTFEPKAKKLNITARKRFQGRLDILALTFAFQAVLKKHEILFFRILKLYPAQLLYKKRPFNLFEKNLASLSKAESESALESSIHELNHFYSWRKSMPMVIARLFHIKEEETELQICMPHIISDDISPEILFADLSMFYLQYNTPPASIPIDKRYRDYQISEQNFSRTRINRDLVFWQEYLHNASLITFPSQHVVRNMATSGYVYSTYLEISEKALNKLRQFCAMHYFSITDGLCAVLGLALVNCGQCLKDEAQHIFMNIVKSTRDNHLYDHTIGCFLKLEPIKISLSKESNLVSLSKEIHQSTIDTAPYQRCSSLAKISCIGGLSQKKNKIKQYIIGTLIKLYTSIFRMPAQDRKTLQLSKRLMTSERINEFVINVNIHKSFLAGKKATPLELFGLKAKKIKKQHSDILEIDQFLDVCLMRDDSHHTPFIVISANLQPELRQQIGKEMIRIIQHET